MHRLASSAAVLVALLVISGCSGQELAGPPDRDFPIFAPELDGDGPTESTTYEDRIVSRYPRYASLVQMADPGGDLCDAVSVSAGAGAECEVVDGLESTNESVLTHRQNDVLRLLTVISVTILPLTLVTGLFGMNVLFPGEGTHEAFWAIVAALAVVAVVTLGFFRWKRWL